MTPDQLRRADRIRRFARLLDNSIRLPVIGKRIGLDGVVGLVPGIGDAATGAMSAYLIVEAWRGGARKRALAAMVGNALVDSLIGAIPIVGDLFDFVFKANQRNARIALAEFERNAAAETPAQIASNR